MMFTKEGPLVPLTLKISIGLNALIAFLATMQNRPARELGLLFWLNAILLLVNLVWAGWTQPLYTIVVVIVPLLVQLVMRLLLGLVLFVLTGSAVYLAFFYVVYTFLSQFIWIIVV